MTIRLTGMSTGLDVDSLVKQMMVPYTAQVDKVKQSRQTIQWKQDLYRDTLGDLNTFKRTYFDTVTPATNMLISNNYAGFDVSSSDATAVTATAGSGAIAGAYTVSNVTIATKATKSGPAVTLSSVNDKASTVFSGSAAFIIQSDAGTPVNFSYNFSSGGAEENWTVAQVLSDISSKTGLNASYSQLSNKFSLSSIKTGSDESITVTPDGATGLVNTLFGISANTTFTGTNAGATITDPQGGTATVVKSSNNFTIDGVNYNLVKDSVTTTNITVTANVQKTYDKIKVVVDKYNEIIDKINTKLNEKPLKAYPPLTDDQKKAMTPDEITIWETNAKTGLLRNDSNLRGMLSAMRSAFYTNVDGVATSLTSIGLSTSNDYTQGGKIIIDETKLKDAIANNQTDVTNIFMQQSSKLYSADLTDPDRITRNSSEGIFQRIGDILKDYARTISISGKKGILVEKAGITGNYTNLLSLQLASKDTMITDLTSKLAARENSYYLKFSKLESAMTKMNAQSSWMTQQASSM